MKPVLLSKKLWTTIITAVVTMGANYIGKPELIPAFAALGVALVVAFGLADFGKEATAAEIDADKDAL